MKWTLLALVALMALAPAATAVVPVPTNGFEVTETTLFLTNGRADVGPRNNVLTLSTDVPSATSQLTFLLPGVSVLPGVIDQPSTESWYYGAPATRDTELVSDTTAVLYFFANVQATTVFSVRLYDIAPDGKVAELGEDIQQFATALTATPVQFHLATASYVLREGHYLQMEVAAQTLNLAVIMEYGGGSPSALSNLNTRSLDTDGDKVSDSDERKSGSNPLDAGDQNSAIGPDADKDGLADRFEEAIGTNPNDADSDDDNFSDGVEIHAGTNPLDAASKPYDANGDGLPDSFANYYFTNTTIASGLGDGTADPDEDGCNNLCEAAHGTDPNNPDTDGDGVSDGAEVAGGTNPAGANSLAAAGAWTPVPEPVAAALFFAGGSMLVLLSLLRRP